MGDTEIFESLRQAVIDGDALRAEDCAREALRAGVKPADAIEKGLLVGIKEIGDAFSSGDTFLPELITAADAMTAGSAILQEEIERRGDSIDYVGKVVMGTVKGDVHDIGKSLVSTMFKTNGFEVIDLGTDVPAERFVDAVQTMSPDILGLSSLLTSTAMEQGKVIEALAAASARDQVRVIVGGGASSLEWAERIGADGYAIDAASAVQLGREMLGIPA